MNQRKFDRYTHLLIIFLVLLGTAVHDSDGRKRKSGTKNGATEFSPRIVGGQSARPNEFPYQVRFFNPGTGKTFCGGTIISPLYILSAAHCFQQGEQKRMITYVGDHSVSKKDAFEQVVKVVEVIQHEQFSPTKSLNDIALLKLSEPLTFSKGVKPALLPKDKKKPAGMGIVSGWGYLNEITEEQPDILQKLNVPIISNADCAKAFRGVPVPPTRLCANAGKGKDNCKGDGGGPLTQPLPGGSFQLIGIVSVGKLCAKGKPSIYTDVAQFSDWISSKMDK